MSRTGGVTGHVFGSAGASPSRDCRRTKREPLTAAGPAAPPDCRHSHSQASGGDGSGGPATGLATTYHLTPATSRACRRTKREPPAAAGPAAPPDTFVLFVSFVVEALPVALLRRRRVRRPRPTGHFRALRVLRGGSSSHSTPAAAAGPAAPPYRLCRHSHSQASGGADYGAAPLTGRRASSSSIIPAHVP